MTTAVSTPSIRAVWPCAFALALTIAAGRPAPERELQWELQASGWLARAHSTATTRVSNTTAITRFVTVAIPAARCREDRFTVTIVNHNGKSLYSGKPGCESVVAPVPAGMFVEVGIGGSGEYELALSLH